MCFSVTDDAIYKRLDQEGAEPFQHLFQHATQALHLKLEPFVSMDLAPFAAQIYALNETTQALVSRMLPSLRDKTNGDTALMPGKFAGLFDVRR